jgi:hypothetical protein
VEVGTTSSRNIPVERHMRIVTAEASRGSYPRDELVIG